MLKLIVFDCDGVMFDSKNANCNYYNFLLESFNCTPMDDNELSFVHMHSVLDSVDYIFRNHPEAVLEKVHELRMKTGYDPFLKYMQMEADLIDFLKITSPKYDLAISTNRTNTMVPLLKTFKLDKYFGKVMTASNATRPKPAPDALLEILAHYNCPPQDCIFIGDSIIDEQHAAGCSVDLIAFKSTELQAKYHVNSFTEILTLPPFTER